MIDVCAVIEQETGQKVDEFTSIESLEVDSLELLELLITLGIPNEQIGSLHTVGDLIKAAA
jgi:acyl carrier protein